MWFSRTVLGPAIALFALALAGCADMRLQPLATLLDGEDVAIHVVQSDGRNGQLYSRQLRNWLREAQASPTHDLFSELTVSSSQTFTVRGSNSKLRKMTMSVYISLVERDTGTTVLSDTITAGATLDTVSSHYAQSRSDRHGHERLALLLADRVAKRVHLHFIKDNPG